MFLGLVVLYGFLLKTVYSVSDVLMRQMKDDIHEAKVGKLFFLFTIMFFALGFFNIIFAPE